MADIVIKGGILITMNPKREVIEDGAVVIEGQRIIDLGITDEVAPKHEAGKVIDARHKAVLPGLIDSHAHAGHGLVKTMGSSQPHLWKQMYGKIYTEGSGEEFWHAEAMLSALERLKCGTTCGVSYLGGGDNYMRSDEPVYGERHCQAVQQVGIRNFLAVGPGRPPFPLKFSHWHGRSRRDLMVSFEDQLQTCEALIRERHLKNRIHICLSSPTIRASEGEHADETISQAEAVRELSRKYGVLFTQDGHTRGTVKLTDQQTTLLGPDAFLSHCTELSAEEIEICRNSGTRVVHNPSAIYSIRGRCPVPELIDAGVTVMLGSDGTAPDRSYDMFRHMFHCLHYHRTYYRDPSVMPAGKVLEMVTIDAARGLGLDEELGSLEAGKMADLILVDLFKAHTYPLNMPVFRTVYFANGADVDTVIVDGEILMEARQVRTVNETEVLERAQRETETMLERTGLHDLLETPVRFWGHSRY